MYQSLRDDLIQLRPYTEADIPALVAALQDPDIPRFTRVPSPYGEAQAREFLASDTELSFAIVEAGRLVGGAGLLRAAEGRVEVGYWVARDARGRGVATRAVRLLARLAFDELGFERVELHADVENLASHRVAENAGFTREGVLRSHAVLGGRRRDMVLFSLLPSDLA